jgi:two-component system, cell cycle response regulator
MAEKKKHRILLVDDQHLSRQIIKKLLGDSSYDYVSADSGSAAFTALEEDPDIDIVILDLVMPEVDGFHVLQTLKADSRWKDLPVIIVSHVEDLESIERGLQLGADDYFKKSFSEEDRRIIIPLKVKHLLDMKMVRDELLGSLKHAEQLSTVDELTDLYNYRYFLERLAEELARATRYERPLTLLMLDLDNLKSVNDKHGHLTGSRLLKEVGRLLKTLARKSDIPCRYGGDEFVVIAPETSEIQGKEFAERLRSKIYELNDIFGWSDLKVSISIGLATTTAENPVESAEKFISCADVSCYDAKKSGKNCVASFGDCSAAIGDATRKHT